MERRAVKGMFLPTILVLVSIGLFLPSFFITYGIGIGMIALAMLMVIYLAHQHKFEKIKEPSEISNRTFIETQITKLEHRMHTTSKYMWVYFVLLVGGINISYLGAIQPMPLGLRIGAHILVTIMMFIIAYYSIRKKKQLYQEEIVPLIHQLEALKEEGAAQASSD